MVQSLRPQKTVWRIPENLRLQTNTQNM